MKNVVSKKKSAAKQAREKLKRHFKHGIFAVQDDRISALIEFCKATSNLLLVAEENLSQRLQEGIWFALVDPMREIAEKAEKELGLAQEDYKNIQNLMRRSLA